jgi:hypothetical protein
MNALSAVARIIAPSGPWQNIGAPFAPKLVIVQLGPEGLFVLFGALQAASSNALIATLPDDAQPVYESVDTAMLDGAPVPIRLLKNGQVRLATAPAGAVGALHISTLFYGA